MEKVFLIIGILILVFAGVGLTDNRPPISPQTQYTVIAQGQEFRVNGLTRGQDVIVFRDYYEKINGRWVKGTDEITVDGYILRERLIHSQ